MLVLAGDHINSVQHSNDVDSLDALRASFKKHTKIAEGMDS